MTPPAATADTYADDAVKIALDLQAQHHKECIAITARRKSDLSLAQSKFGGLPLIPAGGSIPVNEAGQQLSLLAQINCAELPANQLYPEDGWLQFWYLEDALIGVNFDDLTAGTNHQVVYLPATTVTESEEAVQQLYQPYVELGWEPLFADEKGRWGMHLEFTKLEQGITIEDGSFPSLFIEQWNQLHPQKAISDLNELPDEAFEALMDDDRCSGPEVAHQLGGYPYFTQDDPRADPDTPELAAYSEVLLQIDSQFSDEDDWEICFGDAGVVNFFITPAALAARDFSSVLYTMDCT